jgi:hypothetical protein
MLDTLEEEMLKSATESGFTTIDEMLASEMGAGVTYAHYYEYLRRYYTGYGYFQQEYDKIAPTDADIEAYFTANEETFAGKSITKESGKYIDVRHILKKIDSYGTKSSTVAKDDPNFGYTQEAWDACLAEAQKLLDEWLAGEHTEATFAELAQKHSADGGSKKEGGLYSRLTDKTNFVKPFKDWYLDEARVKGDYGLVKTDYGYHIMYFSGAEEQWIVECRDGVLGEKATEILSNAVEAFPMEVDYKKIMLGNVDLSK